MEWDVGSRIPGLCRVILISWIFTAVMASVVFCQEVVVGGEMTSRQTRLPDGLLGKPSIVAGAGYASVSGSAMHGADFQTYWTQVRIPIHPQVSSRFSWNVRTQDSVRYQIAAGLIFYLADPLTAPINPDGPIMRPVIIADGGFRFYGSTDQNHYWIGNVSLQLPISSNLTLAGGYRYYENEEVNELVDYYGCLNIYFGNYHDNERFSNPDGPPGFLAAELRAGGSAAGHFGQAKVLLPLNMTTTVAVILRGEWFETPSQKALVAGLELSVYP